MLDALFQRLKTLKQALTDFVLDAEGDLAVALETFSATHLANAQTQTQHQQTLTIDRFLLEGRVEDETAIDLFIQAEPDLSADDQQLLKNWKNGFLGLFAISKILPDRFELMNWLTAKSYSVLFESSPTQDTERLKEGEILLAQIAPLTTEEWWFFSPWTCLGKLGKPKLAVAIGNFKQNYKNHLYSDAPELLEEAWKSVERYHQDFVDFFGSEEVMLPGYQLSKKMAEFQEQLTQKTLEKAGIDQSKSLEEIAEEAGISQEELEETAAAVGTDVKILNQALSNKASAKMVAPQIELPNHLKQADQVTAISHPRWGQLFLVAYPQLEALLTAAGEQTSSEAEKAEAEKVVRRALQDPEMNAFVWHRLADKYPAQLELLLRSVLNRPNFQLAQDLDSLLQEFSKPLAPELPETASVPIHLHQLFQEAVVEVNKNKVKSKTKKKTTAGF